LLFLNHILYVEKEEKKYKPTEIGFLVNDFLVTGAPVSELSRTDGLILLFFFALFLYNIYRSFKKGDSEKMLEIEKDDLARSVPGLVVFIVLGIVGLTLGGKWVVDGAIGLALALGVSQSLVGLTVVAIGTSLPELSTSAVAAFRGKSDIAIGNVVGSNIFNVLWILGISAAIKPLPFMASNNSDLFMVIFASVLLFLFMFIGKRHILERWQGLIFVLVYISYVATIIARG